jgi:hypothetical protein
MKALAALVAAAAVAITADAVRDGETQLDLDARRAVVAQRFAAQPESRVVASKTHAAVTLETSAGPVVLWVAPTRTGGRCSVVDIVALGVESPSCTRNATLRPWESENRVGDETLRLVGVRVPAGVERVEVRFAGGERAELRAHAGFALRELADGERPTLVVARDHHGRVLSRELPGPRTFRRELPFPTDDYRTVLRLGSSALAVAPGTNGTVCVRTIHRSRRSWSCGLGPRRLARNAIDVQLDASLLQGEVGGNVRRLELWYADGGAVRIPVTEQYVLFEIPAGRTPRLLVGLDADGAIVARQRL